MALTYAAPTLGATAVAALSPGTLVAFYLSGEMKGRTFTPVTQFAESPQGGDAASKWFPSVVSATQVLDSTGAATGPVKLVLAPGTADVVNASSTMTNLVLDQDAVVGTVSGTF